MTDYSSFMPNKKNKKKKSGLGFALWALGFVIILIIFLVKQDDIVSNLKTTRAFERLGMKTPEFVEKHEEKKPRQEDPAGETVITLKAQEKKSPAQSAAPQKAPPAVSVQPAQQAQDWPESSVPLATGAGDAAQLSAPQDLQQNPAPLESAAPAAQAPGQKAAEPAAAAAPTANAGAEPTGAAPAASRPEPAAEKPKPAPAPTTRNAKLYFVVIEGDGAVSRKAVTRPVAKSDLPLSANIKLLLAGPNQAERGKGCMSLIPEGTRLLSASVAGGIAMLNFSEEFEYNRVGVEGYLGQLMQIVFTATEFSTVSGVQILIDGQKKEYLGSEGVWIGSPLSRSSF